jgi:hypothetical protein
MMLQTDHSLIFKLWMFVAPRLAWARYQSTKKKMSEIIAIIGKVYGYSVDKGKMMKTDPGGYAWTPNAKTRPLAKHLCGCDSLTPMFQMTVGKDGVLSPEGVVFFTAAYKDEGEPVTFMKLLQQTCIFLCFGALHIRHSRKCANENKHV